MLKLPITYTSFDEEPKEVTETFYFNLSKRELIKMAVTNDGGIQAMIKQLISETDKAKIIEIFEEIILMAYGERSEDGTSFKKSDEIREKFKAHAAYDVLFDEMTTGPQSSARLADFINGVFPKDMVKASDEALKKAGGDVNKALEALTTDLSETTS